MKLVITVVSASVAVTLLAGCVATGGDPVPQPASVPESAVLPSPEVSAAVSQPPSDGEVPGRFRTARSAPATTVVGCSEIVPSDEISDSWNLEWDEASVHAAADVVQRTLDGRADELYIVAGGTAFWVIGGIDGREAGVAFALFEGLYEDGLRPIHGVPYVDQDLAAFFRQ
jgi:hypothetical protein